MADVKITELPDAGAIVGDEFVPVVSDPAGTPATERTTIDELVGDTGQVLGGDVSGLATNLSVGTGSFTGVDGIFGTGESVAVGIDAKTASNRRWGVAVGYTAFANGQGCIAIGRGSSTGTGGDSVAIGRDASATNGGAVVVGAKAQCLRNQAVAIGELASASGSASSTGCVAISYQATTVTDDDLVAIGREAKAGGGGDGATALGAYAEAVHLSSVALGTSSITTADYQVMVGPRDVEVTDTAKGVVLKSPDATRYRITVADGGSLVTTAL